MMLNNLTFEDVNFSLRKTEKTMKELHMPLAEVFPGTSHWAVLKYTTCSTIKGVSTHVCIHGFFFPTRAIFLSEGQISMTIMANFWISIVPGRSNLLL